MSALITTSILLSSGSIYVAQKFLDQFIKDEGYGGMKKFLFPKKKYSNRLAQVIYKTVDEYKKQFDSNLENGKIPFYHSQILFEKLSSHILLKTKYESEIISIFDKNQSVQKPTENELNVFFKLFVSNIKNDKELKKLHLEENYQNEIFKISDALNIIEHKLDQLALNTSRDLQEIKQICLDRDLEDEWRTQLRTYETLLLDFKPKTALILVEKLEVRILEKTEVNNHIIQSKIEFLKGLCFEQIFEKKQNSYNCFIKSHELNPTYALYKEKACVTYFMVKDYEKAKTLFDEILKKDSQNIFANVVKLLLNLSDFENTLSCIPEPVRQNIDFRRILYVNLRGTANFEKVVKTFPDIILINSDLQLLENNYSNFKRNTYITELVINKFLKNFRIEFGETRDENPLIKESFEILNSFINNFDKTEIADTIVIIKFFNTYLKYLLYRELSDALLLKQIYDSLPLPVDRTTSLITANVIQQSGNIQGALEFLNNLPIEDSNILNLKLYCAGKIDNKQLYVEFANKKIEICENVSVEELIIFLNILRNLSFWEKLSDLNIGNLKRKVFEKKIYFEFLEIYIELSSNRSDEEFLSRINEIKDELIQENPNLQSYVQEAYFANSNFIESVNVFKRMDSKYYSAFEVGNQIDALIAIKSNFEDLLIWLKYWRENFPYFERFTRHEIEKCALTSNWKECEIVCEYAIRNQPLEEFIWYLAISMYNNDSKEKFAAYVHQISAFNFQRGKIVIQIVNLLLSFGFYDEGLELCYIWAKEKDFKPARTLFFANFQYNISEDYYKFYDKVEIGHFIRYSINSAKEKYTKEITDDIFSRNFLEQVKGSVIKIKREYSPDVDDYKILAICNKYMALKLEIIDETANPHSGLGMQSFNLNDYDSPMDLFKQLGDPGYNLNEPYEKYYSEKINFSQLAFWAPELKQNFVVTYYKLVHDKKGLLKVNPKLFPLFELNIEYDYILDFTSILHFYGLSKTTIIHYKKKFKISNYLNVILKSYKENTLEYVHSESYKLDKKFYEELSLWISENCEEVYPTKLLELLEEKKNSNIEIENNILIMYLLNQAAMLNQFEHGVLITDDLTYYKIYPLNSYKILSTDVFLLQEILKAELGL